MITIGEKLRDRWLSENIKLNGAASEQEIGLFESKYNVLLPQEMRDYFLAVDGMGSNSTDDYLIRFWSLKEVKPLSEEALSLIDPQNPYLANSLFVFADYSIWAIGYGIELREGQEQNAVFAITGSDPDLIAESFSDFIDTYLTRHSDLL